MNTIKNEKIIALSLSSLDSLYYINDPVEKCNYYV